MIDCFKTGVHVAFSIDDTVNPAPVISRNGIGNARNKNFVFGNRPMTKHAELRHESRPKLDNFWQI